MKLLINNFKEDKSRFISIIVSLLFGIISLIVYSTTGIIKGYTDSYNVGLFVILILAILINVGSLFTKYSSFQTLSFVGYFISIVLFLIANANYIVAVIRAIDLTSVNSTFVITIILLAIATISGIVSTCLAFKKKQ